jgi:DNA polymerase I-like protein with 3'-5' exonuclease and polymerase domains
MRRDVTVLRDVRLHIVESTDDAMALKRWLGERRETPVGLDTESGDLSPWHSDLRLVQFGDLHHGWAVPWPLWGGLVQEVLKEWQGDWVLHNSPHDVKFLRVHAKWDPPWHRMHDTMTLAGLDDPLRPRGLKPLATKLVDPTAAGGEKLLKDGMARQGWTWATVPYSFAPYFVYSALDPVLTCHLYSQLRPRVDAACPDAYDLELGALRVVTGMMLAGVLIDVPYVQDARAKLDEFAAGAREWLAAAHAVTSPMSAGQISRALGTLGREITQVTPTGQPKVDKDTLEPFREGDPDPRVRELVRYVLAVRHAEKLTGTYLDAFLEKMDADHRLHCTLNPMGARTHRMSSSDPNLQNLPRDDKVVRGSIIPAEGNVFVGCDLSQVEARLAAHFSEDPGLIQAFKDADENGSDFFCGIASGIFGESISKGDPRRQLTKNVVYTSLFGGGLNKMAQTAGVPVEVMRPAKEGFDAHYPGLRLLTERIVEEARAYETPRVYLPTGRHLVADDARVFTQLTNAKIQGVAAEYFKKCLLNIEASGLGSYLRLVVHDEAILEVPVNEAESVLKTVEDCMTDTENYRVNITAEGKIMASRWQK